MRCLARGGERDMNFKWHRKLFGLLSRRIYTPAKTHFACARVSVRVLLSGFPRNVAREREENRLYPSLSFVWVSRDMPRYSREASVASSNRRHSYDEWDAPSPVDSDDGTGRGRTVLACTRCRYK